ncbi:MAG: tRNA dihydrouridine synthase DusB, partial [Desulfobacterales bacterium]
PSFERHQKPLKKVLKTTTVKSYTNSVSSFFGKDMSFNPNRTT